MAKKLMVIAVLKFTQPPVPIAAASGWRVSAAPIHSAACSDRGRVRLARVGGAYDRAGDRVDPDAVGPAL